MTAVQAADCGGRDNGAILLSAVRKTGRSVTMTTCARTERGIAASGSRFSHVRTMDRRANILPRWLALPLLALALAGLPGVTVRAAAPSPPPDAPSARIVFLDPSPAGRALAGEFVPRGLFRGASRGGGVLPPRDRISMVLKPASRHVEEAPEQGPGKVTIRVNGPVSTAAVKWPSVGAPPVDEPMFRLRADPQPERPTPQTRMSVTIEPADGFAEPPIEPSARPPEPWPQPGPERQPEAVEDRAAGADSTRAPQEPATAAAEPPIEASPPPIEPSPPPIEPSAPAIEPRAQPGPDRQPEAVQDRAAGADPDRAPQEPATAAGEGPQLFQSPPGSLLLPPEASTRRSEQLESIARQADRQIRRGFELASRGAYFAARSQFIRALRLVAQGLDAERQTDVHSRSLGVGLTALGEAEDFIPAGSRLEADLDIAAIIEGHRTPVLKDTDTEKLTPLSALRCYFTFAQEQLAAAAGSEVAGSMALHALAKLHGALARQNAGSIRAAETKAVSFYQAAVLAYPRNHMAANDLGVLLARCGNYREAEAALKYSLSIQRQPTGWHNLAVVYRQLGEAGLARQAERLAESARRAEIARRKAVRDPTRQQVRWVDPRVFTQVRTKTAAFPPPTSPRAAARKVMKPSQPRRAAQRSIISWLPWTMPEKRR